MAGRRVLTLFVVVAMFAVVTVMLQVNDTEQLEPVFLPSPPSDSLLPSLNFTSPSPLPPPTLPDLTFPPSSDNYTQTQFQDEVDNIEEGEDEDYQVFLEKLQITEPGMEGSVIPWEFIHIDPVNSTYEDWELNKTISLPSTPPISCKPTKFGLTDAQASSQFIPKAPFTSCCTPSHHFLTYLNQSNEISIKCSTISSDYILGQGRSEERLGDVAYKIQWKRGFSSVKMINTEYAFGRCGMTTKEAILMNKFDGNAAERAEKIARNASKSVNSTENFRPISIFLILFDSVSRLHFYRNFPHTISYLNEKHPNFTSFDFQINNAEGENTPPNMISMLYGMKISHFKRAFLKGLSHQRTDQFLEFVKTQRFAMWKEMERKGFVTMFGFDTIWDFLSPFTGRVIDTDHMVSNFYHAARRIFSYNEFSLKQRCIGCHYAHYYPLNYLVEYQRNYEGYNRFGYVHISTGHEHTGTVIKTADDDLRDTLKKLMGNRKENEDMVVMVASDHGLHVGSWDRAYEGFLENQLPTHILIANNDLLHRLGPDTISILRHNSQRLVSRWDWYLTFKHLSTVPYGRLLADSVLYQTWKNKTETPHAVSLLLERIPNTRTCADMHIPLYYCSCLSFNEVPASSMNFTGLLSLPLNYINTHIESTSSEALCHPLSLKKLLKVFELKTSITSSYFKIRFSVEESSKAVFDAVIRTSRAHNLPTPILNDNPGHFNSSFPFEKIELHEVIRTDKYAGICEELAKVFGVRAAYCICDLPFSETAFQTVSFTDKIDSVLQGLSLVVPDKRVTCIDACLSQGQVCAYWALPLLNDEHILQEVWRPHNSTLQIRFLSTGVVTRISDMNIVGWEREGSGVRMLEGYRNSATSWTIKQSPWTNTLSCADSDPITQSLCPCY